MSDFATEHPQVAAMIDLRRLELACLRAIVAALAKSADDVTTRMAQEVLADVNQSFVPAYMDAEGFRESVAQVVTQYAAVLRSIPPDA